MLVLDVNDIDICLYNAGDGKLLKRAPAVACIHRGQVVTGVAAARMSLSMPRNTCDAHWDLLDCARIANERFTGNHAELAADQLLELLAEHKGRHLVVVIPPWYGTTQYGILGAMMEECGCSLDYIVPAPLLIPGSLISGKELLFLDLHRHRSTLTRLHVDDMLHVTGHTRLDSAGIRHFEQLWLKGIADEAVHAHRFDPLHAAGNEEFLRGQLGELLPRLREGESEKLRVDAKTERTIEVTSGMTVSWAAQIHKGIADAVKTVSGDRVLVLSHRAAAVPGLASGLERQLRIELRSLNAARSLSVLAESWVTVPDSTYYLPSRPLPVSGQDGGESAGRDR